MAQKLVTVAQISIASYGTAQQVSSSVIPITSIIFQAHPNNAGNVYVGDSNVSSTRGVILEPGDFIEISADNRPGGGSSDMVLSDFYVDGAANSYKIQVSYIKPR